MPLPMQMSARREPREAREREDPMSHRIIEKRRRDRMNNCLADLSRLIPAEYLKKGRGRVEKTEIIEMAIKHMQYLQSRANLAAGIECGGAEGPAEGPAAGLPGDLRVAKCEQSQSPVSDRAEATSLPENASTPPTPPPADPDPALRPVVRPIVTEHYRLGYQECLSEAMHFLVEVEGYFAGDSLCVKLISHLQKHCDKIVKGDRLNVPRTRQPGEATSSSGSSSSYGATGNGNGASSADSGVVMASKGPRPPSSSPHDAPARAHPAQLQLQLPQHPHPHSYPHGLAASHLRDILCSSPPSPQYHHPLAHRGLHQHYDSCTDTDGLDGHDPHPDPHHHYADPHHQHNSYKFKNTIQQRFSEEHGNGSSSSGLLKRRRTMTRSPPPSPPSPSAPSASAATPSACASHPSQPSSQHTAASLPIFVLHARGAFYIPLSVSYEVLAPYLDADLFSDPGSGRSARSARSDAIAAAEACATMTQVPPGVVLHPVTISVNFQHYVKQQPLPAQAHSPHPHPHPALVHAAHALVPHPPPQTTPTPAHGLQPWGAGLGLGTARTDAVGFVPTSPWELSARH